MVGIFNQGKRKNLMHPELYKLLHDEHKSAQEIIDQIDGFLDRQEKDGGRARQMPSCHLEHLFDCVLGVDPPEDVAQTRKLIGRVKHLKLWLDGVDLLPRPRDIESTGRRLLMKCLNDERVHPRWACKLIDAFPDGARQMCMDSMFCSTISAPVSEPVRGQWSQVIGKLIAHAIDRDADDMNPANMAYDAIGLEGVVFLWEADEKRWEPDRVRLEKLQWICQNMKEDTVGLDRADRARKFASELRRRALEKTAGLDVGQEERETDLGCSDASGRRPKI